MKMFFFFSLLIFQVFSKSFEYNRLVYLEWKAISGAVKYEVEWKKTTQCSVGGGVSGKTVLTRNSWTGRLEPGDYCVRVRGKGRTGVKGLWSDYQKITVFPKSPFVVEQVGKNNFKWDRVPYAERYEIEVVSEKGEVVHSAFSTTNRFSVPDEVMRKKSLGKRFQLNVKTVARGTGLRSPPSTGQFSAQGRLVRYKKKNMPPQPQPEAISAEESVARYFLSGERPLPPKKEEWKKANGEREKEILRQRTIASSRIELLERQERTRLPDLKLTAGSLLGTYYYYTKSNDRSADRRGLSPRLDFAVDYGQSRSFGGYLRGSIRSIGFDLDSKTYSHSNVSFGLMRNFKLDSIGESTFFTGLGVHLSQHPLLVFGDGNYVRPVTLLGFDFRTGHRYQISDTVQLENGVSLQYAPRQNLDENLSMTHIGGEIRSGGIYRFARNFDFKGGLTLGASQAFDGEATEARMIHYGVFASGQYRLSSANQRNLAAENYLNENRKGQWRIKLEFPYGYQVGLVESVSGQQGSAQNTSLVSLAADLEASYLFSREGSWGLGAGLLANDDLSLFHLRAEFESAIFSRRDTLLKWYLGLAALNERITGEESSAEMESTNLYPGFKLTRAWTEVWLSELGFNFAYPISMRYPNDGNSWGRNGMSYLWNLRLAAGYRLSRAFTLWGGYGYQKWRYSVHRTDTGEKKTTNFTQNQVRLGISVNF